MSKKENKKKKRSNKKKTKCAKFIKVQAMTATKTTKYNNDVILLFGLILGFSFSILLDFWCKHTRVLFAVAARFQLPFKPQIT